MLDQVVVMGLGWLAGWLLATPVRTLHRADRPHGGAAVIVPARNESARIGPLLASLSKSEPRPAEVVVVDDESDDGTAEIVAAAGFDVLSVSPPSGWRGKTWACWQGAGATRSDVLVFLDADTEPDPFFVSDLAAAASEGGLVSVQPYLRVTRFSERMAAVAALVAVMGSGTGPGGRRGWWRRPSAYGPAMAILRSDYVAMGGHAAVKTETVEDFELAKRAAAAGLPVRTLIGADRIECRPYPEASRPLVEGWTRVLAKGAGSVAPARLVLVVAWIAGSLVAIGEAAGGRPVGYAAYAAQFAVLLPRMGSFGLLTAAAYPLPLAAFLVLFARSASVWLRGGEVGWRGRRVRPGGMAGRRAPRRGG